MLKIAVEMYIGLILFELLVFVILGSMLLFKTLKAIKEKRKI